VSDVYLSEFGKLGVNINKIMDAIVE